MIAIAHKFFVSTFSYFLWFILFIFLTLCSKLRFSKWSQSSDGTWQWYDTQYRFL